MIEILAAAAIIAILAYWRSVRPPSLEDLGTVNSHRRVRDDNGRPI